MKAPKIPKCKDCGKNMVVTGFIGMPLLATFYGCFNKKCIHFDKYNYDLFKKTKKVKTTTIYSVNT